MATLVIKNSGPEEVKVVFVHQPPVHISAGGEATVSVGGSVTIDVVNGS